MFTTIPQTVELPNLKSVETSAGRFYQSPETKLWYPSVTTVVGHAKKEFFKEWRNAKPENAELLKRSAIRGNTLHSLTEKYLQNSFDPNECQDPLMLDLFKQIEPYLKNIRNIRMQEQAMWSDGLRLAGRVDCIAEYCETLSVIDFKGSTKIKKEEWIQNYFEQATCYAVMHRERTGIPIKQIVIIMATEAGSPQIFVRPVKDYLSSLATTIKNFWKQENIDAIQSHIMKG